MSDIADLERVRAWCEVREPLERQLSPIGEAILDRLALQPGEQVLDIGCGIARSVERMIAIVGPAGGVTGVDVNAAAIDLRRSETDAVGNATFLLGDAQRFAFQPDTFDAAFSRFGTMFFDDSLAAFVNIHRALRPGGRLAFACWRTLDDNELDAMPLTAAAAVLPVGSVAAARQAEHFAFADPDYLHGLLVDAGYRDVVVESVDVRVSCGDLAATVAVSSRFGSLGKILRDHPGVRDAAVERFEYALAARDDAADPHLTAATWIASARKPLRP